MLLARGLKPNFLMMELNLTQEQVLLCLERSRLPISLDLLVGEERNTELGELLEDTGISPEDYVIRKCGWKPRP